jgi:hypothetical protein
MKHACESKMITGQDCCYNAAATVLVSYWDGEPDPKTTRRTAALCPDCFEWLTVDSGDRKRVSITLCWTSSRSVARKPLRPTSKTLTGLCSVLQPVGLRAYLCNILHDDGGIMKPVIWTSTVYRSRWSKRRQGTLTVEGRTRSEALATLAAIAATTTPFDATAEHARKAVAGECRHTLVRTCQQVAYAAQDGSWRGWDSEAWQSSPPKAYAWWNR